MIHMDLDQKPKKKKDEKPRSWQKSVQKGNQIMVKKKNMHMRIQSKGELLVQ